MKLLYRIIVTALFFGGAVLCIISVPSFGQESIDKQKNIVSITGRLVLESQKEEGLLGEKRDRIILHGKDRKIYIIHGDFEGVLKSLLSDLGKNNLVSVKGLLRERYDISTKTRYGFTEDGGKKLEVRCIRLYHLKVTEIIDAKRSDEEIPPPERDYVEEARIRELAEARLREENSAVRPIRNIQGKISSLNLRSPIKTIEISSPEKNIALLISSETRIVKKTQDETEEPIFLSPNSLRKNQEVFIEYLEDEYKPEALFITILKE